MARILIVDDEPDIEVIIKQRFRKEIKDGKYSFIFSRNGKDALENIKDDEKIDIVMTDINMPGMDGLTLLSEINRMNIALKSIVISAYGDLDKIRAAMNFGAFDFLVKPIEFKDMELTIEKTLEEVKKLKEAEKLKKEIIENRIKLESEKEQRKLADSMRESLKDMTSTLNKNEVSHIVLEKLQTVISFDYGFIFLKEKEIYKLMAHSGNIEKEKIENLNFENTTKEYLLGECKGKRYLEMKDEENQFFKKLSIEDEVKSIIFVPIIFQKNMIGTVILENFLQERYSNNQIEIIETFVEQAAIATENALLFEEIEYLATIDGLTGMINRRHFFEIALAEFRRSVRYKADLAVIMIDVDNFKNINDVYGHAVGDDVLRAISKIFIKTIRETDIAGRYGGEEFIILLPETDLLSAVNVAERIRENTEKGFIETERYGNIGVTVSLGVAEIDGSMQNVDELFMLADKGLYIAKKHGRNRYEICKE